MVFEEFLTGGSLPVLTLRLPAIAIVLLASCALVPGCGGKSRRMSEGETQSYKLGLIRSRGREISPHYAHELMANPSRTRGEIDSAFERYKAQYAAEMAEEQARFSAARGASTHGSVRDARKGEAGGSDEGASGGAGEGSEDGATDPVRAPDAPPR